MARKEEKKPVQYHKACESQNHTQPTSNFKSEPFTTVFHVSLEVGASSHHALSFCSRKMH